MLCEGDSEELATCHFLRRQFAVDCLVGIGLHPINLAAKLEDVFVKTRLFRSDRRVLAVFTLIDLYGMNRVRLHDAASLDDKVEVARDWLRSGVGNVDSRFFYPHLCVHEIEAWFLAEGQSLAKRLKHSSVQPLANAEELDFAKPPKVRVNELFRKHLGRNYHEVRDGTALFKGLAHDAVYRSCRHYREFYDELCEVARRAVESGTDQSTFPEGRA